MKLFYRLFLPCKITNGKIFEWICTNIDWCYFSFCMYGCGIGYSYKKASLKRKTVREEKKNEQKSKEEFQIGPKISTNLKRSVAQQQRLHKKKKSSFCSARYSKDKCRVCMCMLLIKVKKIRINVNIKKTIAMLFVACINVSFYWTRANTRNANANVKII